MIKSHRTLKKPMGMTPQYFHTIPMSCAILPTICLVLICGHRRVVGGCNVTATEHYLLTHSTASFFIYAEAVECTSSAESVWH